MTRERTSRGAAVAWRAAHTGGAVLASVAVLTACSSRNPSPVAETPSVQALEQQIAAYAQARPLVVGVGDHLRCAIRLLDNSRATATFEAVCSSTSDADSEVDQHCIPADTDSIATTGVITLTSGASLTDLRLDQLNDSAYSTWIHRNLPTRWHAYEDAGPHFGQLLDKRLQASYGCKS